MSMLEEECVQHTYNANMSLLATHINSVPDEPVYPLGQQNIARVSLSHHLHSLHENIFKRCCEVRASESAIPIHLWWHYCM